MLINSVLDSEDFVHFYFADDVDSRCGESRRRSLTPPPSERSGEQFCLPGAWDSRSSSSSGGGCGGGGGGGGGGGDGGGGDSAPAADEMALGAGSADAFPLPSPERDEPGLRLPFRCLAGEGAQHVGRTQDGAVLALTNYRLYHGGLSVPVRLVDAVDVKDIFYLHVSCKDARCLKLAFGSGEACAEWARRVCAASGPPARLESLFAFAHAAWSGAAAAADEGDAPLRHRAELERLGFEASGAWRVSRANADYRLCASYPRLLVVPASVSDEALEAVARFRSARRVPAVVWRHAASGAVIARSSQPEVGWLGWRSEHDERMLAALAAASPGERLLVVDARSYASAVTNRARGGGCECSQYYPQADIQFLCLPNIHSVRRSFHALRVLAAEPERADWYAQLERSLWLQAIGGLLRGATLTARAVAAGRPVLLHCSDGWDRTPQLSATAQLLLDPHYRTREGFRTLVEREWLDFGHKFADRCGHAVGSDDINERCPVFIQWLDCVHQITKQYPCSFEFNEAFLVKLARHAHTCLTGTFLCNSAKERRAAHVSQRTICVWALLKGNRYRNPLYALREAIPWPEFSMRSLRLWSAMYVGGSGGSESAPPAAAPAAAPPLPPPAPASRSAPASPAPSPPPPHKPETLGKARSYDELLSELDLEENGNVQRRSSDSRLSDSDRKNAAMLMSGIDFCKSPESSPGESPERGREELAGCFTLEENRSADGFSPFYRRFERANEDGVDGRHNGTTNGNGDCDSNGHSKSEEDLPPKYVPNGNAGQRVSKLSMNLANGKAIAQYNCAEGNISIRPDSPEVSPRPGQLPSFPESVFVEVMVLIIYGIRLATLGDEITEVIQRNRMPSISLSELNKNSASCRRRQASITWRSVSESSQLTDESGVVDLANEAACFAPSSVGRHHTLDRAAATLLEAEIGKLLSAEADGRAGNGEDTTLCPNTPRRSGTSRADDRLYTDGEAGEECGESCCGPGDISSGCQRSHPHRSESPSCSWECERSTDASDGLSCPHSPIQSRLHRIILDHKMREEALCRELRAARAALVRRANRTANAQPAIAQPQTRNISEESPRVPQNGEENPMTVSSCIADALSSEDQFPDFYDHFTLGEDALRRRQECEREEDWSTSAPGLDLWNHNGESDNSAARCHRCNAQFWHGKRKHDCRRCGGTFCADCSECSEERSLEIRANDSRSFDTRPLDAPRFCRACAQCIATKPKSCSLYVENGNCGVTTLRDSSPQPSS